MEVLTEIQWRSRHPPASGDGPPVILVGYAFNDRSGTAPLAAALAARLTVFNYDRRGRGDSGDTAAYSVGARDPGPRRAHRPGRGILGGLRPLLRRDPRQGAYAA